MRLGVAWARAQPRAAALPAPTISTHAGSWRSVFRSAASTIRTSWRHSSKSAGVTAAWPAVRLRLSSGRTARCVATTAISSEDINAEVGLLVEGEPALRYDPVPWPPLAPPRPAPATCAERARASLRAAANGIRRNPFAPSRYPDLFCSTSAAPSLPGLLCALPSLPWTPSQLHLCSAGRSLLSKHLRSTEPTGLMVYPLAPNPYLIPNPAAVMMSWMSCQRGYTRMPAASYRRWRCTCWQSRGRQIGRSRQVTLTFLCLQSVSSARGFDSQGH